MDKINRPKRNATKTEREKWKQYLKSETQEERFLRVSKPLVARTLKSLSRISKMVGSANYKVSFDQIHAMTEVLKEKVDNIEKALTPKTNEQVDTDLIKIYGK